jgi:hypothetical protein
MYKKTVKTQHHRPARPTKANIYFSQKILLEINIFQLAVNKILRENLTMRVVRRWM